MKKIWVIEDVRPNGGTFSFMGTTAIDANSRQLRLLDLLDLPTSYPHTAVGIAAACHYAACANVF